MPQVKAAIRIGTLLLPLTLVACTVDSYPETGSPAKAIAEIDLHPGFVEFPVLDIKDRHTEQVGVVSVGPDILHIEDVYVEGAVGFTVDHSQVNHKLLPGHQTTIPVSFSPVVFGEASADLVIFSDDVDHPIVRVGLAAFGWGPVLDVTPGQWAFDELEVGCEQEQLLEIRNMGSGELTLHEVLFSPTSDELTYSYDHDASVAIGADESLQLSVHYAPRDEFADSAYLWLTSDDPVHPQVMVPISGSARYGEAVLDEFPIGEEGTTGIFELTEVPVLQTLGVELNGVPVYEGWVHDAEANAVVFAPQYFPDSGDVVAVFYNRPGSC